MAAFSRKRQPDETREDFARVSEIKKEIRTRKGSSVEPFTHDEFSLAAASILRFNRDLALKPIEERRKVMNAHTASDEDLLDRIRTFNRGTSENLLYLYRDKSNWVRFRYTDDGESFEGFAILELGEILNDSGVIIGTILNGKMMIHVGKKLRLRAHLVLAASGRRRPNTSYTADHINFREPLNDSIFNLRWATSSEQVANQREKTEHSITATTIIVLNAETREEVARYCSPAAAAMAHGVVSSCITRRVRTGNTYDGLVFTRGDSPMGEILPTHPKFEKLQVATSGLYRTHVRNSGCWGVWRSKGEERPFIKVGDTTRALYVLMIECVLGRELDANENGDHIDGDTMNNTLTNLHPMIVRANIIKRAVKLVSAVKDGSSTVFLNAMVASESTGVRPSDISGMLTGKITWKHSSGYTFRDASIEEIISFFDSLIEEPDIEKFESCDLYPVLKTQKTLNKEWTNCLRKYNGSQEGSQRLQT
jgi:hypothetical protein